MANIDKVKYRTDERFAKVPESNLKKYKKYLQSSIVNNPDVKETTYYTYQGNFELFLTWLANEYDEDLDLYSEDFMDNAVDIMEGYMLFCQETLLNHKKTVNNKVAAVSSFYLWSAKRGLIKYHPFKDKLDRMKGANNESIINSYFLTEDQIKTIRNELSTNKKYNIQDRILFEVSYDSANRIGALEKLKLSSLDLDDMLFDDIREKRGKHVEVVFEEHAKELINQWLEMRKDKYDKLECDSLLIVKRDGKYKPMGRAAIHGRMRKFGRIIGIEDFRAHCMRKSRLNNVYEETGDLSLAADLANHESTETTRQSYIRKQSKSEVRDKINKLRNKKSEDI